MKAQSNDHLCDQCQIVFSESKEISEGFGANRYYDHWPEYRLIQNAAGAGCGICKMLCQHFHREVQNAPENRLGLQYCLRSDAAIPHCKYLIMFSYRAWPHKSLLSQDSSDRTNYNIKSKMISLSRAEDIEPFLLRNPSITELRTDSLTSWESVLSWMHGCLRDHPRCNESSSASRWWPTRLLEIVSPSAARLIISAELPPSDPYITLSHRWGEAKFTTLTAGNLEEMKTSIKIESLPKTFRDFLIVAQRFKIRYVWIDSLCIIQDSRDDWQTEASLMSEVYRNAFCNVAATGATESGHGLFFNRNLDDFMPCKVNLSWANEEGRQVYAVDPDLWRHHVTQAPLIQRAWVVQERILAKRVIHFGMHQILWECREKEACEIFPAGLPFNRDLKSLDEHDAEDHDSQTRGKAEGGLSWSWHRVVLHYSGRYLTRAEDREAAISGVTTLLGEKLNDSFIAGLWRKNLPFDLLWSVGNPEVATRPIIYRAPTWSWLSIDGAISTRIISANIIWRRFFTEVEDVQIQRSGSGPLAPIKSGSIKVRGYLRQADWEYRARSDAQFSLYLDGVSLTSSYCSCNADILKETARERVWCLMVELSCNSETISEKEVLSGQGLILRQHGNTFANGFERLGTFYIDGELGLEALFRPHLKRRSPFGKSESSEVKSSDQTEDSISILSPRKRPRIAGRESQIGLDIPRSFEAKGQAQSDGSSSTSVNSGVPSLDSKGPIVSESEVHQTELRKCFENLRIEDIEVTNLIIV